MKQVKILSSMSLLDLEESINEFIKDNNNKIEVLDIKFNTIDEIKLYLAMVIYEEIIYI